MKGPKIVVIGAGSLFFGRQALWQMLHSDVLRSGTLAYVDTDPVRLKKMVALAKLMARSIRSPLKIQGSTERRDVLRGADFVVLSFARDGVKYRGIDCVISAKYGVRMCSGDTIGPGGIFRAMRELPVILQVARDVRNLCPDAWLINYINPTAVNGIGLMRHAPKVKSFALCDGHHMPHLKHHYLLACRIAKYKNDISAKMERDLNFKIAGVNHFTWLLSLDHKGRDLLPTYRKHLQSIAARETPDGHSKSVFNVSCGLLLWDVFGAWPDCMGHTKEYLPYWQGTNVAEDGIPPLAIFDAPARQKLHDAMWAEIDQYLARKLPPSHFHHKFGPDHATDIIESMWGGLGKQFFVNQPNRGAVANLDDDAFLELLSDLDMNGPRPLPVGPLPTGIRALEQVVLETHELTAQAIVSRDRALLRRAMLLDPIVNSIPDADAIIAELLEAERDALPRHWRR